MEMSKNEIAPILPNLVQEVPDFVYSITDMLGVPRNILAPSEEIFHAWNNLPRELYDIPEDLRNELIARMCVAISTGLFDSAMNYVWNAAILNLRNKVRLFGLKIIEEIKGSSFEEKNLVEMRDFELLKLCNEIDILSEEGYRLLNQSRDLRNNFSAAHPPIAVLNDRELITFINRCVKYALSNSYQPRGVEIKEFIKILKSGEFTSIQLEAWKSRIEETHLSQMHFILYMLYSQYCDPSSTEQTRNNSLSISKLFSKDFNSNLKSKLINGHQSYQIKGDEKRSKASRDYFEKLNLLSILSDAEIHSIISKAVNDLESIHHSMNNFYNEPHFAERLMNLGIANEIPVTVKESYVSTVVMCRIGNPYGISVAASDFYDEMIRNFTPKELSIYLDINTKVELISDRLKYNKTCRIRFSETMELINTASLAPGQMVKYDSLRIRYK